jgi:hypothetical protein
MDNFKKEILFVFDNPEDMFTKEAEIVTEDFLAEETTYNLKVGGFGGFDYLNSRFDNPAHSKDHLARINKLVPREIRIESARKGREAIKQIRKSNGGKYPWPGSKAFLGKKHTPESKIKMSKTAKDRLVDPTKNSQYNTQWITDGKDNMKIQKGVIIPNGWKLGRILMKKMAPG